MMAANEEILHHTSPVIIYSTTSDGQQTVRARRLAKHTLPWRAFGYEFRACMNPDCNPPPYQMHVKGKTNRFRVACSKCGWKSAKLELKSYEPHVYQVNPVASPLLFWHSYPASPGLQNLFVDASRKPSSRMAGPESDSDMDISVDEAEE